MPPTLLRIVEGSAVSINASPFCSIRHGNGVGVGPRSALVDACSYVDADHPGAAVCSRTRIMPSKQVPFEGVATFSNTIVHAH